MRRTTRVPLLALLAFGLAACVSGGDQVDPESQEFTQMRVKLGNVCANVNRSTQVAVDRMMLATDDIEVKRRLVFTKA